MALSPQQGVVVGTTAVRLDSDPHDNNAGARFMAVAQGAGTVVLGGSDSVTAGNGCRVPVVAGTIITEQLDQGEQVWAIVASGSITFDVLMGGV
ncbi:MAG TPA: hypothetical protein VHC63_13375 [Acidimicrobiales bacterium]|nr:hypothetical protein [Acidimicrobiales bacterium]